LRATKLASHVGPDTTLCGFGAIGNLSRRDFWSVVANTASPVGRLENAV